MRICRNGSNDTELFTIPAVLRRSLAERFVCWNRIIYAEGSNCFITVSSEAGNESGYCEGCWRF